LRGRQVRCSLRHRNRSNQLLPELTRNLLILFGRTLLLRRKHQELQRLVVKEQRRIQWLSGPTVRAMRQMDAPLLELNDQLRVFTSINNQPNLGIK
jgi:hypothetical protein